MSPTHRLVRRFAPLLLLLPMQGPRGATAPPHRAEWLARDGLRLRAVHAGTGDTTVVFLHGYGESLVAWRGVIDAVAPRHRVLALDLPGFGLSDKPAGPYDVTSQAARLRPFLAAEQRPLVLVGHSMGGAVALALAADATLPVVRHVLVSPAGFGLSDAAAPLAASGAATVLAAVAPVALPEHAPEWLAERGGAGASWLGAASLAAARAALRDLDFDGLDGLARRVPAPTLVVWGRLDPTTPWSGSARLMRALPCGRLVTLGRALHRPHQAQPDTVASLLLHHIGEPPRCDD